MIRNEIFLQMAIFFLILLFVYINILCWELIVNQLWLLPVFLFCFVYNVRTIQIILVNLFIWNGIHIVYTHSMWIKNGICPINDRRLTTWWSEFDNCLSSSFLTSLSSIYLSIFQSIYPLFYFHKDWQEREGVQETIIIECECESTFSVNRKARNVITTRLSHTDK